MKKNEFIRISGSEYWGEYLYLITAGGHALLEIFFDKRLQKGCCEIGELNTHPDYQRQGLATMLVKEAEKIAKERGYHQVLLWTKEGSWMQQWYERMGYEVEVFMRPPHKSVIWLSKHI